MPNATATRLDENCKRLLAAILELSLVPRRRPLPQQPEASGRPEAPSRLGLDRAMKDHSLGTRHMTALLSIALFGPMSVTQLAKRHHSLVKTASQIAVDLEEAGLVERSEDPADRRRTIVGIAKRKERAVDDGLNKRAAPLRRTLDRLTPSQREGLITGLEMLVDEMSGEREVGGGGRSDPQTAPMTRLPGGTRVPVS